MRKIVDASCKAFVNMPDQESPVHELVILQLAEDDENTAVMRYLTQLWAELSPVYEDISKIVTSYDKSCTSPIWRNTA